MNEDKVVSAMDNLLCRKWTLRLLMNLQANSPRRFNEISNDLSGISSKTLSKRLKTLKAKSIIKRKSYSEIPPRVEYSLTEKGEKLIKSFDDVMKWAENWM
ncbi:hypothetical protein AKJ48_03215 [candidate division MSBL1 archaeon SCGC-AAA261O19]|uniref:HTH hxlR-type domain-containing protein n=2 Tax=candidate division MSBL1 TaxID=215777 RepID=A0A133V087_9EURY|nr:hypothetical protein AKJ42_02385 [candidate division MSBL1 archaeon SCGC-AAA261C02]KXB04266.1 hypothetical protein AKJ48_03215 [candidate division MSBL1 archaeon SCGC-AAA261O19]